MSLSQENAEVRTKGFGNARMKLQGDVWMQDRMELVDSHYGREEWQIIITGEDLDLFHFLIVW
jgi:hypothetical protein